MTGLGINVGLIMIIIVMFVVFVEVSLQNRRERKLKKIVELFIESTVSNLKVLQREISVIRIEYEDFKSLVKCQERRILELKKLIRETEQIK
jgi:hypothetical protein